MTEPATTLVPVAGRRWLAPRQILAVLVVVALAAAAGRMLTGTWPQGDHAAQILGWRLEQVLAAAAAGAALAVSGVGLQALLRNPLAEPFILGLSTGAALGVFVQTIIRIEFGLAMGANHIGAMVGAMAILAVVYFASRRRGVIDPLGLLLTGVVLATICGALIMVLNYWVGPGLVKDDIGQWMMGYLNDANLTMVQIRALGVFVLAGLAGLMFLSRAMDAASFSDAEAMSLGVNLKRLRLVLFIVCGLLAAGAVVLAGPIAFVGLICPHIARLLLGPSHRTLLVGSALIGATMLILANIVSIQVHRSFGTGIMPIGAFAALVGGPTFLWMLRPQLGKG